MWRACAHGAGAGRDTSDTTLHPPFMGSYTPAQPNRGNIFMSHLNEVGIPFVFVSLNLCNLENDFNGWQLFFILSILVICFIGKEGVLHEIFRAIDKLTYV